MTDGQGKQREFSEHRLQEGQLDFQRMLLGVSGIADDDLRQIFYRRNCLLIDWNDPKRRGEAGAGWQGQPIDCKPMRRAKQNDTSYRTPQGRERGVSTRGDRPE